jgi:hypothetical protein
MILALIIGTAIALFNILLALIISDWNIALILSGTISIIAIIITSLIRNLSLLLNHRPQSNLEAKSSMYEAENIAKLIFVFSTPHILISVILFLRIYGIETILEKIKFR